MIPAYHPLDPTIRRDPYPVYKALRHLDPVHQMADGGFAISRHADIHDVLSRPEVFSSEAMRGLIQNVDEEPDPNDPTETLLGSDPPRHTGLRKLVNRGFSRRRVAALETQVRETAVSLVQELDGREDFDLITDFAAPLTVRVIAELLGVDPERHADFSRWSAALVLLASGAPSGEDLVRARAEKQALGDYLDDIIESRRRNPQNDLISALARLETKDGPLGQREVEFLPNLLLIAGNETTTHLIGNLMSALFAHPAQMELIASRPELIPGAIEEGLRFDSPIQVILRTTTREVTLRDQQIPEASSVALLLGSGNRDERVFPHAERFDVTRDASGHLGLGHGTHFCLGAPLARLEARVALETLLPMGLRAAGPRGEGIASLLVRGTASVPVRRSIARRHTG